MRGDINIDRFVIASALISMWTYVLYSSGSALIGEKWSDTLKLLIAAPTSLFHILLVRAMSNSVIALISMILTFVYARFIFQIQVGIESYSLFFFAVIILVMSLSVIGISLAMVFVAFQNVFGYQNLIQIPVILISGVFIPVENFPQAIQIVAYSLPMTWGIQAINEAMVLSPQVYTTMFITLFISVVYLFLAKFIIAKMELVLRKDGRLGAI